MVDDPSPTITEDNIGKMETGLEPCHEMLGEEVTTREDQKMDEEERISDIDSDGSSMLPCAASTTQKEKQVHEEVQSDMKEEEEEQEDVMDVTEVDTVTGEELVLRCWERIIRAGKKNKTPRDWQQIWNDHIRHI